MYRIVAAGGGGKASPATGQNLYRVKLPINDTLKGQAESTHVYYIYYVCTLYRKSPLKEDNLSTKENSWSREGDPLRAIVVGWLSAFFVTRRTKA